MIFSCKNIKKSYGIDVILEKVSFNIEEKEKVSIVGVNGAGKTTVFKIITNKISYDEGELFLKKSSSIGYLEQNVQIDSKKSIYDEMLTVFELNFALENELRNMEEKMSKLSGKELTSFMEIYSKKQLEFEQMDGYSYKSRINGVLKGLGFTEGEYNQPIYQLSGGQKTRVFLGKLLLTKPDLLLLDEPTNHLDIESIQWLEEFLKSYDKAVILISHDRYFMDKIVTKVIEIENKKSYIYNGNYTNYIKQKNINRQIQEKAYTQQQKEIKRQEEIIKTLRSFNREKSIKRAESREKNLEKLNLIDKPENLPDKMRFTLSPKITSGNDVLHVENLSKSFEDTILFENVEFDIKRGDKVALIGANGVGKSTLFKILLNKLNYDNGKIKFGTNVNIGYYDQELQQLDENKTIFQEISDTYPNMTNGEIRNVLAAFVFKGDDIFKLISSLSGGERGRVSLAKIMLSKSNFLMLDEPTNHLDIYSKEILEDAINNYSGTVIYISHDRYFINRTAKKVLELTKDGIKLYLGDYSYYIEKKLENSILNAENSKTVTKKVENSKTEWEKQKEQQAKERKLNNKIKKLEQSIEETEIKIQELEALLFTDEISMDPIKSREIYEQKVSLEGKLDELYNEWGEFE